MNDVVVALLGGGVLVQLFQAVATLRQSRRQLDAGALGGEVAALEKTISVLYDSFEREVKRHERVASELEAEVASLRSEASALRGRVEALEREGDCLRRANRALAAGRRRGSQGV